MMMKVLKVCAICKALSKSTICPYCWEHLLRLQDPIVRYENGITIHSLFRWHLNDPKGIWWLLKSLKGHRDQATWSMLAGLFLQNVDSPDDADLIPIPGRSLGHTFGFAAALAETSGLQVVDGVLNLSSGRIQKSLGRIGRQTQKFGSNLTRKYCRNVILVDDVVTTGATLRAAFEALGRPVNCSAWALVDRRPCGGS